VRVSHPYCRSGTVYVCTRIDFFERDVLLQDRRPPPPGKAPLCPTYRVYSSHSTADILWKSLRTLNCCNNVKRRRLADSLSWAGDRCTRATRTCAGNMNEKIISFRFAGTAPPCGRVIRTRCGSPLFYIIYIIHNITVTVCLLQYNEM